MNTPKGLEVRSRRASLAPLGPEWIADSFYGLQYGLCERDGQRFLCALTDEQGGWKILMPADETVLSAFRWCREHPGHAADPLTRAVLLRAVENGHS